MEKDLDLIPQKPGGRKHKIERTAKKKKQKNNYKEGDAKSLSVDIVVENPSDNLGDVQRQLDREMQIEIDRVLNSEELSVDERSVKIELIKLGYEKRILEEQKRIEIEDILNAPGLDDKMKADLIESIKAGYQERIEKLANNDSLVGNRSKELKSKIENESFDREAIMKDFNSFFDKLRIKLIEFEKKYKDNDNEACEKIGKNIRYWARKIKDFEDIENPSSEDMEKMLQLHDEVKKMTEENWIELHEAGKLELTTRDDLEKDQEKAKNMEEKYAFSRKVADIARVKTDNYEKLNGATDEERDENFKNEIKRILKDNLVFHGKLKENDAGEFYVEKKPDLDCKASLGLIEMAKIKIDNKKIHYEKEGGSVSGKINIDTGGMDGLVVLEDGTVFIDHHGKESSNGTSATEKTLEVLINAGLLKDFKYLRKLVSFVNRVDNFNYPKSYFENYFTESWRTLYGLSSMLQFNELKRFFECKDSNGKPLNPGEPMDDELLKKIGLIRIIKNKETGEDEVRNKSASHKERVLKAKEELDLMEKEGFIIESDRYGKICLNIDGRMKCGTDAAKAFGCDTYLAWNNNSNNFFISSLNRKKLEDDFGDGLNVRGTMWINPLDKERKITLAEILNKMTDGKFEPSEAVKKILEAKESHETENEEKEDETVELSENTNEAPENTEEILTDLSHAEIGHPAPETINEDIPIIDDFEYENAKEFSEEKKVLSSEELKKVLSLERREKMGENREALRKKFGSFILNHQGEEFCKVMLHRILDLDDKFAQINRKFRKMEGSDEMDENILNEINKLDGEIINLVESDWEEELEKFKQNSVNEKFGLNEKEQKIVEKSKEIANKFIEKARADFPWENFPQKRVDFALETQAVFFLMEEFKKRKFFKGKEEELAEFIVKNRNKK